MLFNSFQFLGFYSAVFALYYAVPRKGWQLFVLIAASAAFYGWNEPKLLELLSLSVLSNAITCWLIQRSDKRIFRIVIATVGVMVNLSLLLTFKYAGMLASLLDGLFHSNIAAAPAFAALLHLPLPIGISFYTFEGICLLVETLRGDESIKRRLVSWTMDAGKSS